MITLVSVSSCDHPMQFWYDLRQPYAECNLTRVDTHRDNKDILAKPCYQLTTRILEQRPKLLEACHILQGDSESSSMPCVQVCKSHVQHYEIMSANCNIVQSLSKKEYTKCTKLQKKIVLIMNTYITAEYDHRM